MRVLLLGHLGNMGTRYRRILEHLGVPYKGYDFGDAYGEGLLDGITHILIATPTETHIPYILAFKTTGLPILCEKPLTKNLEELEALARDYMPGDSPLQMVHQYDYLTSAGDEGETVYNYFKTGGDGLHWDCIQIIGLARGALEIKNTSPIWDCVINGRRLDLAKMDHAYVEMISNWLASPKPDLERILSFHRKVASLEKERCKVD